MRTEDLLDVLSEVDDELLERSENVKTKNKVAWGKWFPLAACACLILVVGVAGMSRMFSMKSANDATADAPADMPTSDGMAAEDTAAEESVLAPDEMAQEMTDNTEPAEDDAKYEFTTDNNPFKDADAVHSALILHKYDGKDIVDYHMYGSSKTSQVLDVLWKLDFQKSDEWPEEITYPIYGIEIGKKDGFTLYVAWSDGYWITGDGEVFQAEFDPSVLETDYEWDAEYEYDSMSSFPCARYLSQNKNGWNVDLMTPSEELNGQEGVQMKLVEQRDNSLRVQFDNQSGSVWEYGEFYAIQVLLNGTWYDVPTVPGNWAFVTIGYSLPAGDTVEEAYNLDFYGELPKGMYRIVVEGLAAEFEIK